MNRVKRYLSNLPIRPLTLPIVVPLLLIDWIGRSLPRRFEVPSRDGLRTIQLRRGAYRSDVEARIGLGRSDPRNGLRKDGRHSYYYNHAGQFFVAVYRTVTRSDRLEDIRSLENNGDER